MRSNCIIDFTFLVKTKETKRKKQNYSVFEMHRKVHKKLSTKSDNYMRPRQLKFCDGEFDSGSE